MCIVFFLKEVVLYCLRLAVRGIYAVFKILPIQKNKVIFLSRQFNSPGLDFRMLRRALEEEYPAVKIQMITKRLDGGLGNVMIFAWDSLRSLYHLATARVCILDSYWPMVSMVHHKKELTVIQMWHAMGKIKKSGYQTLNKAYGHNGAFSRLLCMHRGYDVVVAGGAAWNPFYCESFHVTEDKLFNVGLPRIDYLLDSQIQNRIRVMKRHPEFHGKKVILYAPTFRKHTCLDFQPMIEGMDKEGYALIIKPHPNQIIKDRDIVRPYLYEEFSTMTMLTVCDYIVTDYSAIAAEAAVLRKRTLYYVFDYDEYIENNGLNLDLFREMPGCVFRQVNDIVRVIQEDDYDDAVLDVYAKRYLPPLSGPVTPRLVDLIVNCLEKGKDEGIRESLHRETETDLPLVYQDTAG